MVNGSANITVKKFNGSNMVTDRNIMVAGKIDSNIANVVANATGFAVDSFTNIAINGGSFIADVKGADAFTVIFAHMVGGR